MKYNTISSSSLSSEGRKSTLTLYTDPDFISDKVSSSESEISSIRGELEIVQRALKLQTRRCRQLVAEYTRRLQDKEQQYQSEKLLRDNQLARVLRALLIFEARLKQEQKFISHQLEEKDYIIKKQRDDISKLSSSQYCKHCNQFYSPAHNLESLDSSTEYVATDYQDYQSSNFESLDSSSETYATISEKEYKEKSNEEKQEKDVESKLFQKNKPRENFIKRGRKLGHRKSVGTYFEVLKLRNDSPSSNEDNTSNDYENLESLPAESVSDKISVVSERIESIFAKSVTNLTEDNLDKHDNQFTDGKVSKISENIPVFEGDDGETNNWYASASDQEDDEQRDIYRNNPVLECMNQILMQNINDNLNSPPKTPTLERRQTKNSKRVKFSDEEDLNKENGSALNSENIECKGNYYETPIQKPPNFYETPQSIYSNDYEQILSKCSETFSQEGEHVAPIKKHDEQNDNVSKEGHYYVDMDAKAENEGGIVRKSKILRTPPALPPKPANLLSKYKMASFNKGMQKVVSAPSIDSEPDYCSISELNLPTGKVAKLNVVAEVNSNQESVKVAEKHIILHSPKQKDDLHKRNEQNLIASKAVEKVNIQIAKQTCIKSDLSPTKQKVKIEQEIPKLPQVSEILIPEEDRTEAQRINHDNYIKNNSQILKMKPTRVDTAAGRRSILMGSSVSSLISSFNNQQLLSELQTKPKFKSSKKMFSSFECLQNMEKHSSPKVEANPESPSFDKFDLSQNFEEFKLDDCDIEEYPSNDNAAIIEDHIDFTCNENDSPKQEEHILPDILSSPTKVAPTRVDIVRATNDTIPQLNPTTIQQLKMKLELSKSKDFPAKNNNVKSEANYEQFLECTGLSSKSILTPSRLLSNHKSMLKPKDVKLRSKVKATTFERQGSTIKYWSEPYI